MKTITIKQDDLFKNIEKLIDDENNIWFKKELNILQKKERKNENNNN